MELRRAASRADAHTLADRRVARNDAFTPDDDFLVYEQLSFVNFLLVHILHYPLITFQRDFSTTACVGTFVLCVCSSRSVTELAGVGVG